MKGGCCVRGQAKKREGLLRAVHNKSKQDRVCQLVL